MNPIALPGWKVARAICDRTESVELGIAPRWTARYETPTKGVIAITPRIRRVAAAFRPWGRGNALTPFAIAATPVSAVAPDEKALRSTNKMIAPVPARSGVDVPAWGA